MHITVSLSHVFFWLLPELILLGDLLSCSDCFFLQWPHPYRGRNSHESKRFIHLGHTVNLAPHDMAVVVVESIIFLAEILLLLPS